MRSKITTSVLLLFVAFGSYSQKQFFKSEQVFTEKDLGSFYSSVTVHGNQVLFVANDYTLYAYDRGTGKFQWKNHISYKTTRKLFTSGGKVFVPSYLDNQEMTIVVDSASGAFVKTLPFGPLEAEPVMRNGVLYANAIAGGGLIFAYDVEKDSTLWSRFIAHGVSNQPYFFDDYIYVNAESNYWARINYKGELLDTTCKEKADIFVKEFPCIHHFNALTHDGHELNEDFSEKIFTDREILAPGKIIWAKNNSIILADDKLVILGKKGKQQRVIELIQYLPEVTEGITATYFQLLATKDNTVTFAWSNFLMTYDFKENKMIRQSDLSRWEPAQAVMENNRLWLVSKKDGLLYGLSLH